MFSSRFAATLALVFVVGCQVDIGPGPVVPFGVAVAGGTSVATGKAAEHKIGAAGSNYAYPVGPVTGTLGQGTYPAPAPASTIAWGASVAAPAITQLALSSTSGGSGAAGQALSLTAQAGQAATGGTNAGGTGGNVRISPGQGGTSGGGANGPTGLIQLNLPTPLSGTGYGYVAFQQGGSNFLTVGSSASGASFFTASGILSLASTANVVGLTTSGPSGSYAQVNSTNDGVYLGGSAINFRNGANTTNYGSWSSTTLGVGVPIGGFSATPLSFKGQTSPNTVACGTGGTQTISSAQAIIPFFVVSGGTLTADCVLDFSTNANTGHFEIAIGTFTSLGGHNLSVKNGTTTLSYAALPTHAGILVDTFGANNLMLVP